MNQDCIALLITQVWQVTLLFVVVWIAVRLFAKDRPHLAHALWVLVLIKCITPPVWSSPASPFSWLTSPSTADVGLADGKTPGKRTANRSLDAFSSNANTIVVRTDRKLFGQTEMNSGADLNPASSLETQTTQSAVSTFPWATVIWSLWICGALAGLLITICRFGMFLRWTSGSRSKVEPRLQQLVVRLSKKLGIKRRVNIRVLDCPVGPAVLGLLRPTILLPAAIVNDRPESELEPLIAHELVHIRRGDLWWAVVQTLAGCLFWFHPLIRIAVQMVTRESERSCDEETVASLGCSPAAYARGLLGILEEKQRLRVAPAVPGVRPVDITSARLERVMKLGNGSLKRTPLWVWLVMFICGAMVLPGAALVFAQDRAPDDVVGHSLPLHTGGALAENTSPYQLESFDIGDLLTDLRERLNLETAGEPEKRLLSMLPCRFPGPKGTSCTPHGSLVEFVAGDNGEFGIVQLGYDQPTMKIRGNKLYVFESVEAVAVVAKKLAELRKNGFRQIVVEVRFLSAAGDALENAGIDWQDNDQVAKASHVIAEDSLQEVNPMPGVTGETGPEFQRAYFPAVSKFGKDAGPANPPAANLSGFEQQIKPVTHAIIDAEQAISLIQESKKGTSDGNILQAPTVTMYNGQTAEVKDGVQRPFVTGYCVPFKDSDGTMVQSPKINIVEEGTSIRVKPTISADGTIDLETQLTISRVSEIQEFTFSGGNAPDEDEQAYTVQLPVVAVERITGTANIANGRTLLLRPTGQLESADSKFKDTIVMMTCHVFDESALESIPLSTNLMLPAGAAVANNVSGPAADETGPLVEASVRLPVAQDSAADETPDSNSQGGLMVIRSTLQIEAEDNFEPVVQSLSGLGLRLRLETDVQLNVVKDGIEIRGEHLEMVAEEEDESFCISGDFGEIEFGRNDNYSMKFTGNAKMKQQDDFDAQAENLLYAFDGSDESFLLEGDAILVFGGCQLHAQKIKFDSERILMEGEARLIPSDAVGAAADIRGGQIIWNTETGMIAVDGVENEALRPGDSNPGNSHGKASAGQSVPSAYYIEDDIQYFPQGPEFKLLREAAALKEARANGER